VTNFQILCAIAVLAVGACSSGSSELSGPELIVKCQKAYASLKSYEGTTEVVTSMTVNGAPFKTQASAHVRFLRPAMLRVEADTTGFFPRHYGIVSTATETWMTKIEGNGWERAESAEMAIAGFTGVSGGSVTTIPALLLNTGWGNTLATLSPHRVTRSTSNGRQVYVVECSNVAGTTTLWIDASTFLLARLDQKMDISRMSQPDMPDHPELKSEMQGIKDYTTTEIFSNVKVNPRIPKSVFSRPHGAH
jgi:hypothetical protein